MVRLVVPLVTSGALVNHTGTNIPEGFRESMRNLVDHVRRSAHTIMPGGTTGEGHLLTTDQYEVLLRIVAQLKWDLDVRAGVLGRDNQVAEQIRIAQSHWINDIVIGCGHTGNYEDRIDTALNTGSRKDRRNRRVFLYNMPGWFEPLTHDFVRDCFERDSRIVGIKDSSGDPEYFDRLLDLKTIFPDRIISHGSEPLYGTMAADRRGMVDEVTAWSANVNPRLLRNFIGNPEKFGGERDTLGAMVWWPHSGFDTSTPGGAIQNYVYGLKTSLRLQEILTGAEDFLMYGDKEKWFFPKD